MNTIVKSIKSLLCYPFILVFFILPISTDLSLPPLISNVRNKGSGQLASSLPFSYIYYITNKTLKEEYVSKYFIKSSTPNIINLQRFHMNYPLYDTITFKLFRYFIYSFIVILLSYIQGISVISIPLGGHAPPKRMSYCI